MVIAINLITPPNTIFLKKFSYRHAHQVMVVIKDQARFEFAGLARLQLLYHCKYLSRSNSHMT